MTDFIDLLNSDPNSKLWKTDEIIKFADDCDVTDKNFKNFLLTADTSGDLMEQWQKNMVSSSKATSAFGATLKTVAANMVIVAVAALAIKGAMWVFDQIVHRQENLNEAAAESAEKYKNLRGEIDSLNSELETNGKRISELNQMDKLTYLEKSELEKLQAVTKELERQVDIKSKELQSTSTKLSKDNKAAFNQEYGDDNFSLSDVKDLESEYGDLSLSPTADTDLVKEGLEGIVAALIKVQKAKEEVEASGDVEWMDSLVNREGIYKEKLESNLSTLQGYRNNLVDIMKYRELSDEEQLFYDNLEQGMKLIYQFTDPNAWNSMEITDILSVDGIEKSKSELIEVAKAGKLDENTLSGYTKLNDVIKNSELITENGKTAIQSFIEEIIALSEESDEASTGLSNLFNPKSITDTISVLDTMADKWKTVNSLYSEFSDKDFKNFSNDGMSGFAESFKDIEGIDIDDFLSTLSSSASTAEDVQEAFNQLSSQYIYASGCLDELTDATAEQIIRELEAQGIVGASAVVMDHLSASKEFAKIKSIDLSNATIDEILAFINESNQADETNSALARYALQKEISNGITLKTDGDIKNMASLVTAAGGAIEALNAYNRARQGIITTLSTSPMFSKKPSDFSYKDLAGGIQLAQPQWELQNAAKLQSLQDEANALFLQSERDIKAAVTKVTQTQAPNSSGNSKGQNSSPDSSGKESEKEFDWIERRDKYLQEEHEKTQKIIDDETRSYDEQISAIRNLIDADKQRLAFAKNAAQKYTDEWNKAKESLSADKISKIMNGDISVESLKGKEAEDIQAAIDAYDKKTEYEELLADTDEEINNHLREEVKLRGEIIQVQQEELSSEMDILQARMNLAETTGQILTEGTYKRLPIERIEKYINLSNVLVIISSNF